MIWKQMSLLLTAAFLIAPQALAQQRPQAPGQPVRAAPRAASRPAPPAAPSAGEEATEESQTVLPIKIQGKTPEAFNIDEEIAKPPFKFEEGKGRDPFQTPLTQKQVETAAAGGGAPRGGRAKAPVEPVKPIEIDEQRKLMEDLEALQARIEGFLVLEPVDEKAILRLDDEMSRKLSAAEKQIGDTDLRMKLTRLRRARGTIMPRLTEIKQKNFTVAVEEKAGVVDRFYEAHQYKEAAKEAKDLVGFVEKNKEVTTADPTVASKVSAIVARAVATGRKAEIREEFEGKAFVVTGINWSPQGASAIINGKIDAAVSEVVEGVKLVKITDDGVEVEYKGERFAKPFVN